MDSYTYNSYARYYDKNFPTDFQKRCNESASLREEYQSSFNKRYPLVEKNVSETNVSESKDNSGVSLSPKVD